MAQSFNNRFLRYEEELALALFFCNVEKFNWLLEAEYFSASILTEPVKIGCKELAPYMITAGYKKILNYPMYDEIRQRNDVIADIIEQRCGISLDLNLSFDAENELRFFASNVYLNTLQSEADRKLINALGKLDIKSTSILLQEGANPLRVIEKDNWTIYSEFINRIFCFMDNYDPGEESWEKMRWSINLFSTYVLCEQIKHLLHQYIPVDVQTEVMKSVKERHDNIISSAYQNNYTLDHSLKDFLDELDQPGAVLAVMDEDKFTYRFGNEIMYVYEKVLDYIMTELKYLSVRVGGNSYRSGNFMAARMREKNYPSGRFVNLIDHDSEVKATFTEPNVKEINMKNFDFTIDKDLVEYADKFDFRSMGRGSSHSLVWYYVNKISCGWYKENGEFMPFNSNLKGLGILTEIAKVRGFMDMKPATAVLYSNLMYRPSIIACKVEQLCKDLNIKSFDIATLVNAQS